MMFFTRLMGGACLEIDGVKWTVVSFGGISVGENGIVKNVDATLVDEAGKTMVMKFSGIALDANALAGMVTMLTNLVER